MNEKTPGREPIVLVQIDQDFCTRSFGVAPCTGSKGRWPGVVARPLIDVFFYIVTFGRDKTHCLTAYESEQTRRQFPEYYRG